MVRAATVTVATRTSTTRVAASRIIVRTPTAHVVQARSGVRTIRNSKRSAVASTPERHIQVTPSK
jgi:hypothetical protein